MQARADGEPIRELEMICTCLKTWVQIYIEVEGSGLWMTPLMMYWCTVARKIAIDLDQAKRSEAASDAFLKKLVEIHRELFQKLNKERTKRAGCVWVCCELLRAYFQLGQISQCTFLLKNVSQWLNKGGFDPTDLPKAMSVTFFFYWGKHCVFTSSLKDAYDLTIFVDIVRAIREGNVQLFTTKMEEHAADFIKMGTYLIMMKLKFTVLRSLTRSVHREVRSRLGENASKLDLAPFEHVFSWQDGCDADETACVIANLIYQGAVKGYLSHEHQKIVFAKDVPFPPPAKWRM